MKKLILPLSLLFLALFSCRREEPIASSGVHLKFSADTVFLDTVFTTVGSSTYTLKVYNPSNEAVSIDEIHLGRNTSSKYRINVDGRSGNSFKNVEILPKDSIYVFVEVTASVIGSSTGYLYTDSILFNNKGTEQNVKLVTLTRDAYFHYPSHFLLVAGQAIPYTVLADDSTGAITWPNDKPHVIYGYGLIANQLNIPPGTEVYFHHNSGLLVLSGGTLKVAENAVPGITDSVTFAGDRLEPFYEDAPGQWGGILGGIYIQRKSFGNVINHTLIKNATTAIRLDSVGAMDDQLSIKNTYILNSSRTGIYGGYGHLKAQNVVLGNAGLYLFYAFGGNYEFRHCTFANYWNQSSRSTAGVTLTNYFDYQDESGKTFRVERDLQSCYFGNCIVSGSLQQEFSVLKDPSGQLDFQVKNALIDVDMNLTNEERGYDINDQNFFQDILVNNDPDFVNRDNNSYQLDSASQAVNQGNTFDAGLIDNSVDILGNFRVINGLPDLGAYERQY